MFPTTLILTQTEWHLFVNLKKQTINHEALTVVSIRDLIFDSYSYNLVREVF